MAGARRTILWLSAAQAGLAREVARVAELELVGVGSPERGRAGPLAAELAGTSDLGLDDLRAALASSDADLVWILDPGEFGTGADDAAAIADAAERGARVVSLEPIPAHATDLSSRGWIDGAAGALRSWTFSPAWDGVPPEVVAGLQVRAMALEWWSGPGEGSLSSRLYGAMDLVLRTMGEPETIDAAYAGADRGWGVHALPGESLRGVSGFLTANLRFSEGRGGTLALGDRAGRWERSLTLVGHGGRARIGPESVEWVSPEGTPIEHGEEPRASHGPRRSSRRAGDSLGTNAAHVFASGLVRAAFERPASPIRADVFTTLAMCHAALLSARTGQAESPATIRRIAGVA